METLCKNLLTTVVTYLVTHIARFYSLEVWLMKTSEGNMDHRFNGYVSLNVKHILHSITCCKMDFSTLTKSFSRVLRSSHSSFVSISCHEEDELLVL